MRDFLDTYISTLSTRRREKVYDLLRASKVEKANLDAIANKLENMRSNTPIVIQSETNNSLIGQGKFFGTYNDIIQRLKELFSVSNDISLLLDTYTSVLTSEIKEVEDDIAAMEKALDNYAFTLSDNSAYDFSFIETFNDDTMRLEKSPSSFTDRSGSNFANNEGAFVNSASGTLTLSPVVDVVYDLVGNIVNSNCAGYITSDTGLVNALNGDVTSGWRMSISAPRPISATLLSNSRQGAQFELELTLTTPAPSDTLVVTPFSDRPFEILLLEIYSTKANTSEQTKTTIVEGVHLIDKPTDFGFPLNTVNKVRMVINQPVYSRGGVSPISSEESYRKLSGTLQDQVFISGIEELPTINNVFRRNKKALNYTFLHSINSMVSSKKTRIFRAALPQIDFDPSRGPMSTREFVTSDRKNYLQEDLWKGHSQVNTIFRRMIHEKILSNRPYSLSGKSIMSPFTFFLNGGDQLNQAFNLSGTWSIGSGVDVNVDGHSMAGLQETPNFLNYEYDLGFRNIQVGRGQRVFRGVFVTKPLPAQSDSGEVRLKTDDIDYLAINSDKNNKLVTSIEYSVTNQSDPKIEDDWIPIHPINKGTSVASERVFFAETGVARLRFPASPLGELTLYRNGYTVDMNIIEQIRSNDDQAIVGLRAGIGTLTPNDIYTVDYTTYGDHTTVNFIERGFEQTNLASAFDSNGAGQTFVSTFNGRSISLANEPYIDYDSVESLGSYSETLGFIGTYQPITIVMENGTLALNQTNYNGITQNNLSDIPDTTVAYVHSGRNITFNKSLNERFTVYYQYLPSNLKTRIVMRVNDVNYISPQVNSIQIKTKTKKPNPRRDI